MIKIAILGSTGSIGTPDPGYCEKKIKIYRFLAWQQEEIFPCWRNKSGNFSKTGSSRRMKKSGRTQRTGQRHRLQGSGGMDGLLELAAMEGTQILVTAIVGMIGIRPTIEGIKAGKDIALANKETLVTAGHIIMPLAEQYGVRILPVDSEHSAIFQALNGEEHKTIDKLLITASGGPFRGRKTEDLRDIQVEDALKHPNWAMGQKITIDSATLVNKGLEVMEAKWLFGVDLDQIQVVVQPPECDSFYDSVYRWQCDGTAWNTGYAAADSICSLWWNQEISGWGTSGFCKTWFYYLRESRYGNLQRPASCHEGITNRWFYANGI